MTVILNIFLLLFKIALIPVTIILFILGLIIKLLLNFAKSFVVMVCLFCILVLGVLMYFSIIEWGFAWDILFYPILALTVLLLAYLFPAILKGINKKIFDFMTLWA